jgi:hypothetical protein
MAPNSSGLRGLLQFLAPPDELDRTALFAHVLLETLVLGPVMGDTMHQQGDRYDSLTDM